MASIAELLANFKTLMHQWFPFTTEMNSAINTVDARIDDVAEEIYMKTGCTNQLRDTVDIVDLETEVQNMLVNIGLTYEGWLSDNGVEECIVSVGQSLGYDDDTVFIVLDHFYFYDSSEEKVSLINDYDVQLEASSYNVNIGGSVTLTATLTDKIGNPIPYKIVHLYKDGSSLNQGITNSRGILSFTVSCSDWGLIDYSVGNSHCQIYVTGWTNVAGSSNGTWEILRNQDHAKLIMRGWTTPSSATTSSWNNFGNSAYASSVRPTQYKTFSNAGITAYVRINTNGSIEYRSASGTLAKGTEFWLEIEWAICDQDL